MESQSWDSNVGLTLKPVPLANTTSVYLIAINVNKHKCQIELLFGIR